MPLYSTTRISLGASSTAPGSVTVGASPYTYQNTDSYAQSIIVNGGIVSAIAFSRDNATYYTTGQLAGTFWLDPGDYLRVTYTSAPTMTTIMH